MYINISSTLLALPCVLYHYFYGHEFSAMEVSLLVHLMVSSLTFHTYRELASTTRKTLAMLYGIDHYYINCGLWYFVNKNVYDCGVLNGLGYTLLMLNELTLDHYDGNVSTFVMIAVVYVHKLLVVSWVQTYVMGVAMVVAVAGFDGTFEQRLSPWSQWKKCMWHGGMGVLILCFEL